MTEFQDIEALWTALFTVNGKKVNTEVVVFETNCVFGGDSGYFYTGSYQAKDGKRQTNRASKIDALRWTHGLSIYRSAPRVSNGTKRQSNADAESQLIAEARCPS